MPKAWWGNITRHFVWQNDLQQFMMSQIRPSVDFVTVYLALNFYAKSNIFDSWQWLIFGPPCSPRGNVDQIALTDETSGEGGHRRKPPPRHQIVNKTNTLRAICYITQRIFRGVSYIAQRCRENQERGSTIKSLGIGSRPD